MRIWRRLEKGSPLHGFRSYAQIAYPIEIDETEEMGTQPYGLDLPKLERIPVPNDHPAKHYLDCACHDGGVFGFDLTESSAVLKLNDYDGWRLAGNYRQRLGLPYTHSMHNPRVPVELEFRGLREFAAYQSEPNHKLTRLRHSLRSNIEKLDTVSSDYVVRFDQSGIAIIWSLRVTPARSTVLWEDRRWRSRTVWVRGVYLCLHCDQIVVREQQRDAWSAQFGEDTVWIWDEYAKARSNLNFLGWDEFGGFLEEIHRKRNT